MLLNFAGLAVGLYAVQKLGGIKYIVFKMKNRGVAGVYEHRTSHFEQMGTPSKKIIFLGDSITEAGEWAELLNNPNAINRGIAGDVTQGVLLRLQSILEAEAEKVFLMIGVNDLIMRSPDYIIQNYRKILSRFQKESSQTKVFVQSVLPVNNQLRNTSIQNQDIKRLNKELQLLAQEFGYEYLDLHTLLKDSNGNLAEKYSVDGIHLNGLAYQQWKQFLNPYL